MLMRGASSKGAYVVESDLPANADERDDLLRRIMGSPDDHRKAAALGVPRLVLTHLIPAPVTEAVRQLFVDDIRAGGYEGELIVADDLYTCAVG